MQELLIVGGVWPHTLHNKEAAHVISHQIIREIARSGRYRIKFLCINHHKVELPEGANPDIDELKSLGVHFLEQVILDESGFKRSGLFKSISALVEPRGLLSGWGHNAIIENTVKNNFPDLVLSILTEIGSVAVSSLSCRKFTYYGNPDYKVLRAGHLIRKLTKQISLKERITHKLIYPLVKKAHLKVMSEYEWVFEVAKNDAENYKRHGINCSYTQLTWEGRITENWKEVRERKEITEPIKIVGSVGSLGATGNSLAFITLATEILPVLEKRLGKGQFEIHIFGGGQLRPGIDKLLANKHIKLRGFVGDLESEILSSPIVLIPNNYKDFKVSHTRFLHSWSLGSCIVAFEDSSVSIPEIEHNKNALLARDSHEIAEHIITASQDKTIRRKLGAGGIATLKKSFDAKIVANKIIAKINAD